MLRRVAAGEQVTITTRGRPVAQLVPVPVVCRTPILREELARRLARSQADPGLRHDIEALAGDTTDDVDVRARRPATLESTTDIELLANDADVAAVGARLRVHLARARRRVDVNDLWIAATASAHGAPVVTQWVDFGPLEDVSGLDVIRV